MALQICFAGVKTLYSKEGSYFMSHFKNAWGANSNGSTSATTAPLFIELSPFV